MQPFFKKLTDSDKSIVLSIGFHLFLLIIFLLVRSGLDLGSEYAEIGFISPSAAAPRASKTSESPTTSNTRPSARSRSEAAKSSETVKSQTKPQDEAASKTVNPPVPLPKRTMKEEEPPELSRQRDKVNIAPEREANGKPTVDSDQVEKEDMESSSQSSTGAENAQNNNDGQAGEEAKGTAMGAGAASNLPYIIEGDAAKRRIISQVLPVYPPGLQREAVVKIRFWVLPDGQIGQMLPVQKGDPELEALTMRTMRQWRFSPLSPLEEQKSVQGLITFVYKLY